ncbi:unnamed protein product [Peronospora destructor]|uniref:subtilisin n=1 Tax=Peronospora destructor TaxID=86335 RepID=A0AAV0TDP4_9STRA|nr:unnamed protein product [Peronospora destructor]
MKGSWLLSLTIALWSVSSATTAAVNYPPSRFSGFSSDHYVRQSRADPDQIVPLVIGLVPKDFNALEQELYAISNPTHTQYGQYLAQEQADHLSRPCDGALEAVRTWVANFSYENSRGTFSATSNLFKVRIKVKHIERLLETELHHYEPKRTESIASSSQRKLIRASTDVSVPEHLKNVVSFLSANTHPLRLRALGAATSQIVDTKHNPGSTLEEIRHTYGIPDDLVATNPANTQCVPSFYNESYNLSDLDAFFTRFLPGESPPQIIEKGHRVGSHQWATSEASLDMQYVTAIGRNATTFVWTMNGSNPYSSEDEPFVEFAEDVLALENPPLVISISYSDDEEHIFDVSAGYARTLDTILIKMGLRGMTVVIAAGDDGVTGLRPELKKIPFEDTCLQSGPQWPSSSPYITTVGATMLLRNAQQATKPFFRTKEEVACSVENGEIITTGGGFSNIYAMPEYQVTAVKRYLRTRDIPTTPKFFNASGRAYPDVSVLGSHFLVFMNSRLSFDVWNISIYACVWRNETQPDAFHDVVVGNIGAPRGRHNPCEDSFSAAAGWDAVSGVGTPNFSVISKFIETLEDHFNVSQLSNSNSFAMADVSYDLVSSTTGVGEMSTFTMVLLIAAVAANVTIGIVVVITLAKRWRNQYTPLDDVVSGNTASVSTTSSASRIEQSNSDADSSEDDVELSEINLK